MALQASVLHSVSIKGSIWPIQSGALLSGDDSLFMGTFGEDLTQAEGSCVSCAIQALPIAREQVPAQTDCYFGLGFSL